MTCYVDKLVEYPRLKGRMGRISKQWCHLWTDGELEELHRFAASLGMKREWFQDHGVMPHYDLVPARRARALTLGAKEASIKPFVRAWLKEHA